MTGKRKAQNDKNLLNNLLGESVSSSPENPVKGFFIQRCEQAVHEGLVGGLSPRGGAPTCTPLKFDASLLPTKMIQTPP